MNALLRTSVCAACCEIGLVEMVATLARKSGDCSLDASVFEDILDNIRNDFGLFHIVRITEKHIKQACELAIAHRLRAMDSLHLASALSLRLHGDVIMVSADQELLQAARNAGLKVLNPAETEHP